MKLEKCDMCKANKVCDHNRFGFENCDNYISSDVVEVRHEKWVDSPLIRIGGLTKAYPSVKCSNCKIIFCDILNNHRDMYHFCPNCGADMRGENDGRLRSSKD